MKLVDVREHGIGFKKLKSQVLSLRSQVSAQHFNAKTQRRRDAENDLTVFQP